MARVSQLATGQWRSADVTPEEASSCGYLAKLRAANLIGPFEFEERFVQPPFEKILYLAYMR